MSTQPALLPRLPLNVVHAHTWVEEGIEGTEGGREGDLAAGRSLLQSIEKEFLHPATFKDISCRVSVLSSTRLMRKFLSELRKDSLKQFCILFPMKGDVVSHGIALVWRGASGRGKMCSPADSPCSPSSISSMKAATGFLSQGRVSQDAYSTSFYSAKGNIGTLSSMNIYYSTTLYTRGHSQLVMDGETKIFQMVIWRATREGGQI